MRYAQLLSELRGLESLALYYSNLVLWKAREMDEYLAEVMGIPLLSMEPPPPVVEPKEELPPPPAPLVEQHECLTLHQHKRKIIAECLAKHRGNIKDAAAELNISRAFFYRGIPVNGENDHD